jgi:hypothetical protein
MRQKEKQNYGQGLSKVKKKKALPLCAFVSFVRRIIS